ncbi:NADH:flavin oxidoreductase/NADH oxidase [Paraburkholderia atlantica]|uniref:NADH:flavin oxidoreductase/NADH oxidase n=1 Tax=Paraburkholderia atlantica TaxID=2654982 RepID=D5WI48_PARAM|nr:NADH:flavin oxidoreductase [Paraburkholderia atlantica]ADG18143.1 NADH:flavin oxidoreductase/NADH oxidase [Paraburkholderia atlantica]
MTTTNVLASRLTINNLEIKNRIILGPMAVLRPTEDGRPSEQTIAFLTRRAKGGVGLIIVGGSVASERAWSESPFSPNVRFDKDEFVPDLTRLTEAVHAHGARVFAQLFPSFGRMGVPRNGNWISSASPKSVDMGAGSLPINLYIPGGRVTPLPKEASIAEIKELEADVVSAARRAKAAGFDGVEIGAHMCYFYSSFLSPLSNQRTDEYGGSTENRARALRDAVAAVRAEVGPGYPVGIRMSVNDHMPGGQGPEGFAEVAGHIVKAGVDFISLSEGNYESMGENVASVSGSMLAHGEPQAFREAVGSDVRLFLSSTPDPKQAAEAIDAGHADASMLARQMLADPDYAAKVIEGREREIVWCDHANSCLRRLILNVPVACHKNPEMGHEHPNAKRSSLAQEVAVWVTGNRTLMTVVDKLARMKQK